MKHRLLPAKCDYITITTFVRIKTRNLIARRTNTEKQEYIDFSSFQVQPLSQTLLFIVNAYNSPFSARTTFTTHSGSTPKQSKFLTKLLNFSFNFPLLLPEHSNYVYVYDTNIKRISFTKQKIVNEALKTYLIHIYKFNEDMTNSTYQRIIKNENIEF